jgi:hypothetical protein
MPDKPMTFRGVRILCADDVPAADFFLIRPDPPEDPGLRHLWRVVSGMRGAACLVVRNVGQGKDADETTSGDQARSS